MGLKIAVIAGGAFEAERSLAAANDVMAALKEAEHEPELFQADGSLAAVTANPATSRTRSPRSACRAWAAARRCVALPTTRRRSPRRSRRTTTSRRTWSRQRFRKL